MNNIHANYFQITSGIITLKPQYRGNFTEQHNSSSTKPTDYTNAISDNGVGYVGSAFEELPQTIVIPKVVDGTTVTAVAPSTFVDNTRIVSVVWNADIKTIPEYCFSYCSSLASIENATDVTTLGRCAFRCTAITSATFNEVTSCGAGVFRQCGKLLKVSLAKQTTISNAMFFGCDSLEQLNMPACTKIEKSGLKVTNNLLRENVTFGTLTEVGSCALDVSGYALTTDQADKITEAGFKGHKDINLYKNRDFVDKWRTVCTEEITEPIILPVKHNFEQEDSMWSATGNGIEWFNWGAYNEATATYDEYLPEFTYERYGWTPEYAGSHWTTNYVSGDETVTGMGCTLHAMAGAYLGLYNPFKGSTVIENPNLFQQLVIEKTGGRDSDGIPRIIKEWDKSQEVCSIGAATTSTHTYTADYKQNLQKFFYYTSGGSKRVDANTAYLTTFVADRIGLKCEVVGYNHGTLCPIDGYQGDEDPVASYLSNPDNWDSYLRYIIKSLKEGKYIELICCYGGSQTHAVLMYGVDKEGYVYINNTAHCDYTYGYSRGHCFKVPFENVFTFYNGNTDDTGNLIQNSVIGSIPLIIFSKKPTALDNLGPSFVRNCEYFLDNPDNIVNDLITDRLIANNNIDFNVLQEIVDTVDDECPEDRFIKDSTFDVRSKLTTLLNGGDNIE